MLRNLFFLSFLSIFMNQNGYIGFGPDRYQSRMLMDKKKDDAGGGTGAGDDEDEDEDEEEEEDKSKKKPGASDKNKSKKKPGVSEDDEEEDEEEDDQESDVSKLPEWAQKRLKKLGKENKNLRTRTKATDERLGKIEKALKVIGGDDEEDETPEVKLTKANQKTQALEVKAAYQEMALEHGLNKEQFKYFSFLMNEAVEELEDGEEMSDEQLEEIVANVKAQKGKPSNNTSVNAGKGGKGPKKTDTVTAEEFKKMGVLARGKVYRENPELYDKLMKEVGP